MTNGRPPTTMDKVTSIITQSHSLKNVMQQNLVVVLTLRLGAKYTIAIFLFLNEIVFTGGQQGVWTRDRDE